MMQRIMIFCLLILLAGCNRSSDPVEGVEKPNIIIVLADDLGIDAVSTYGGEHPTPNLTAMAQGGVLFERGFATPICTPTRVRMLTGRYSYRNYLEFGYLAPEQRTIAHILRDAGYRTAVTGKWQLSGYRDLEGQGATPASAGFDDALVWQLEQTGKGSRYWSPRLASAGEQAETSYTDYPENVFGPDVMNGFALDFIEQYRDQPFFLFYSMVLPHDPFVTTPDASSVEGDHERFAAMVSYMDDLLGEVTAKLKTEGLSEKTLIFFIGDNGTDNELTNLLNGVPVKGGKGVPTQAGIHVPFVAQWPGVLPEGARAEGLAEVLDIAPTFLSILEIDPTTEDLDGVSLWPLMTEEAADVRKTIYMDYDPRWASYSRPGRFALDKRYKLYQRGDFYDYVDDPLEQAPLERASLTPEQREARKTLRAVIEQHLEDARQRGVRPYLYEKAREE